jgi:hypothetical protein
VISETNSFKGIPYADYFNVCTEWVVETTSTTSSLNTVEDAQETNNLNNLNNIQGTSGNMGTHGTHASPPGRRMGTAREGLRVTIHLDFQFLKVKTQYLYKPNICIHKYVLNPLSLYDTYLLNPPIIQVHLAAEHDRVKHQGNI